MPSLFLDEKKLQALKDADFALFTACWWPNAAWDELVILAYLSVWLFVWDDEIDMTSSTLGVDYARAEKFRYETVRFVQHCMGFGDEGKEPPVPPNPIIHSFKVIGDAICAVYNEGSKP